jgi:hypothetical protein
LAQKKNNGGSTDLKLFVEKSFFDKPISFQSNIIGIILIVTGIVYFYNPTSLNVRIGITSILIGIFMVSLITGKKTIKKITDTQYAIIIITLIFLILVFTVIMHLNWEVFIILIFICLLIIKEIFSGYTTPCINERLNIFIIFFIIAFILIVVNKVMDFAGL